MDGSMMLVIVIVIIIPKSISLPQMYGGSDADCESSGGRKNLRGLGLSKGLYCLSFIAKIIISINIIVIIITIIVIIIISKVEAVSSHKPLQEDELSLSRGENANVLKKTSDGNEEELICFFSHG